MDESSIPKLSIYRFLPYTKVEGPGSRACIWVQGCPIRCRDCAVPQTWRETSSENEFPVEEIAGRIFEGPQIEGVTFAGGEPFAQAKALACLGHILREANLSIVTFSGYTLEEIQNSSRKDWHDLLSVTDLLIDGPFVEELSNVSRPWVGSSNQQYHFLTPRYRHLQSQLLGIKNRIEVHFQPDGQIIINGMAESARLKGLFDRKIANYWKSA